MTPQTIRADIEDIELRGLLSRVKWPPFSVPSNGTYLALPKEERAFNIVQEMLLAASFNIQIRDERDRAGTIIDLTGELPEIPFQVLRGTDILTYMREGLVNYAILGSDKIDEALQENPLQNRHSPFHIWRQFRAASFRMCLAVPKEMEQQARESVPDFLRGKIVATSYPNILRAEVLRKWRIDAKIITLHGGIEQAMHKFEAAAIMDIVETGGSLRKHGLVAVQEVRQESLRLFSPIGLQGRITADNYYIARLSNRLVVAENR